MNFVNTSLFVGDLPKFASESDLEQLFSPFGVLLDAKIKRNSTTGKTLSYGFVTFATEASAQEALKAMDGNMFSGRKLRYVSSSFANLFAMYSLVLLSCRVRWAMYNAKGNNGSAPNSQSQMINSVYVRFVTPMVSLWLSINWRSGPNLNAARSWIVTLQRRTFTTSLTGLGMLWMLLSKSLRLIM